MSADHTHYQSEQPVRIPAAQPVKTGVGDVVFVSPKNKQQQLVIASLEAE